MLEDTYRKMNESILPDPALVASVRASAGRSGEKTVLRGRALRRVALAAVLVLCLCFAVPALAVNSPAIYRLMYLVSPAVAQFFVPIRESCEDNGIRMEVVSTYIHGDTAEIYITMQELAGDRIDASIDLYDSYSLQIPFDSMGTCKQVGYDPETKTATFLILESTMDGSPIPGGNVTFSVGCFLSHKKVTLNVPVEMDWSKVQTNPETVPLVHPSSCARVLKPGAPICTPEEGFDVTGLGYVDGALHVQLYTPGRHLYDDHAFLTLADGQGNEISCDMVYHDYAGTQATTYTDHIDYVFPVPQESLGDYTLLASFYAAKTKTEGNWKVTFHLAKG